MQKFLFATAIAAMFISCSSPNKSTDNRLTTTEKDSGWELLFDGKTTKGWHRYGGGPIDSVWKVREGMLCLDTAIKKQYNIKGDWDIATDEEYENYHLKLEWMISKDGNSGIIFNVYEEGTKHKWPWETGPEMQILDNNGHPDAKYKTHRAGDLYDMISVSRETVKPPGEWNLAEIKCGNGRLEFYLNGEQVVSTTIWDDSWKKMIANSKFRNMEGFGSYKKGRIALQDHGNAVCYRNIKIRRL
ncbi:MAG: DUF1080 domain-containing protein [Chitinophagaceae bacterium]|nr:DUF1080 domain-containing protein [Chitinophagaceae bacterium]